MPNPIPPHHDRLDLIAFIAVLALGAVLLAIGIPAASLIVVTVGLAQLYSAWNTTHGTSRHNPPQPGHTPATATPEPTNPAQEQEQEQEQDANAAPSPSDTRPF
ncbi:hypothetical protein ABT144_10985 [Streptomyces sp. NPDC002039]|uniref:hypothetical protein n=1 Tax=unclassified Streptomyces TaxID=2593676 RepID=UPI00332BF4F7